MEVREIKLYKRESLFIKTSAIPSRMVDAFDKRYTHRFYEDRACAQCEHKHERHSEEYCDPCPAYKDGTKLSGQKRIGKHDYTKIPLGDLPAVEGFLKSKHYDPIIISQHPKREDVKWTKPIRFTGTLKSHQEEAVQAWKKKGGRGVIKAPPRSGKTVLSTAAICRVGTKTMILAAQREWLIGFRSTFIGSKSIPRMTDIKPERIGFCKTLADFKKYDVCLVTYQTFINDNGEWLLKKIRDFFGMIVIDEIHTAAAFHFMKVLAGVNCRYIMGLSGTPSRKDNKYIMVDQLLGPIVYKAKVERLVPTVKLVVTKYAKEMQNWTSMVTNLECDPARLKLIAEWAVRDAKNNHMVLIPLTRVKAIQVLTMAINKIAGRTIAAEFHGALKKPVREKALEDACDYKIRVLVGNTKLLSTGTNIPRASMLYDVTPSSNMENCEQRTSRVLTPYEGKPNPVLRFFLDHTKVRKSCLRNEWFGCVLKTFKPLMAEKDRVALINYLNARKAPSEQRYGF